MPDNFKPLEFVEVDQVTSGHLISLESSSALRLCIITWPHSSGSLTPTTLINHAPAVDGLQLLTLGLYVPYVMVQALCLSTKPTHLALTATVWGTGYD